MTEDDSTTTSASPSTSSSGAGHSQAGKGPESRKVSSSKHTLYDKLTCGLDSDLTMRQEMAMNKRVGFYKLRTQLGAGSFSKVKLGVHLLTNESVAVKVIDKTGLDGMALRLLPQEIACMEKMNHPNIVRLYEVIETFSTLHLVMECAGQGTLQRKVTEEGPYSEHQARHTFAQLVSALNYMHGNGMVHRDVKAENIFVKDTLIKLGDFGFSTKAQPSHLLKTFCGSPFYSAPELFTAEQYLGQPVDIWASGVTLYFMLTGETPFQGSNLEQLKASIIAGEFSMPKNLTPTCEDLIGGLLTVEVQKRFTMNDITHGSVWLGGCMTSSKIDLNVSFTSVCSLDGNNASPTLSTGSEELDPDPDVVQDLKTIGLPFHGVDFSEVPRSSSVGTYRILLHRKHSEAWEPCPELVARLESARGKEEGGKSSDGRVGRKRKISHQHRRSRYCIIL